ncbi:hypothetical protein DPMN_047484 [Dreissena polymorpha]|uniref:Uncharacterized protein n=1 Tax=Dreissena polymorpha TaxID=45954 RepID=A0A9D4DBG2_DREPO|nr:hypothetical protein DPMN_047443 [Dreissena polymorpha]KAH3740773.1 hypothetical protein DPMN_047484 [Dreissena polymorpha]
MVERPSGRRQETRTRCQTNILDRRCTSRRFPDSLRRCQDSQGTCRRLQDGARNFTIPSGHLLETLKQSATMPRLSGH